MKRSELRRYTPLKSKAGIGTKKPKSGSKKKTLPTWIKAIPEGSHGSGTGSGRGSGMGSGTGSGRGDLLLGSKYSF